MAKQAENEQQNQQPVFSNKLEDALLGALESLNDPNEDLEKAIKKTAAVVSVGNTMVNMAKVRIDAVRVTKQIGGKGAKQLPGSGPKEITNG